MSTLNLSVVSQEKHLLDTTVDQVSAPSVLGEVTILPHHAPLFTKLDDGIVKYVSNKKVYEIAITNGFMDVSPDNQVTILADSAIRAEDINIAKAEQAKLKAEESMKNRRSDVEFKIAEASLRKALLELKAARRHKNTTHSS